MPRPKADSGGPRTELVSFRLTGAEAEQLDQQRGKATRSDWAREVLLARLRGKEDQASVALPPMPRVRVPGIDATGQDCPHPKARNMKGLCGACGTYVG